MIAARKVVALALRDAGMEVIYSGLHQSIGSDPQCRHPRISGCNRSEHHDRWHLPICIKLFNRMKEEELEDIHVVVGGVIPKKDIPNINRIGC